MDTTYVEKPLRVALAGSSGSIGRQACDVVSQHPDQVNIVALAVNSSVDTLVQQARDFHVEHVFVADGSLAEHPALRELPEGVQIHIGADELYRLPEIVDCDMVLNALVGAAGLRLSYNTLVAGLTLALANKESLVVGGDLIMPLSTHETLLPVDSEHSAIYQCYLGEFPQEARRIWLTASGGPFRGRSREQLADITRAEALAHPTWSMGPKITIDSSTLMNKGLEVIEAHHLFGVSYDSIRVVVHPQSCIHSMVEYADGSVKAHLGVADMRVPIQFAFSYPHRWDAPTEPADFVKIGALTFEDPDLETFGCLRLAFEAGRTGGTAPAVLNAANEIAVAAFLEDRCGYLDIEDLVARALDAADIVKVESIDQLLETDAATRSFVTKELARR